MSEKETNNIIIDLGTTGYIPEIVKHEAIKTIEMLEKEIERLNNIIDKQDRDITTLTKDKIKLKNMINGDDKSVKD